MATFSNKFLSSGKEEQGKLNFKSHPKKSEKSLMNWVTKMVYLEYVSVSLPWSKAQFWCTFSRWLWGIQTDEREEPFHNYCEGSISRMRFVVTVATLGSFFYICEFIWKLSKFEGNIPWRNNITFASRTIWWVHFSEIFYWNIFMRTL